MGELTHKAARAAFGGAIDFAMRKMDKDREKGLLDLVAPFPALCASRRFSISFVHPVYNVSSLHFKIYV